MGLPAFRVLLDVAKEGTQLKQRNYGLRDLRNLCGEKAEDVFKLLMNVFQRF
jgi:hypothetical protein